MSQDALTLGMSGVLGDFLFFIGALIFVIGAIMVSFIVFLLMAQRTKDFGLMKAAGCPNGLVFGYFFTELLGTTFVGCLLGVVLGFVIDYAIVNMSMFQAYNKAPNLWFVPLVFVVFFAFAITFGGKPLFDAAKISPLKAISSTQYFGLGKGRKLKPLSKTGITLRIAARSLFRRKSATVRIVIFLSVTFLLLTICIGGGIIANDTTALWVEKATGQNMILVANNNMVAQYIQLQLTFSGAKANPNFNYLDPNLAVSNSTIQELSSIPGIAKINSQLIWRGTIQEIPSCYTVPDTMDILPIGGNRQGTSLVIGIDTSNIINEPFVNGQFLNSTSDLDAVIGDSVDQTMYSAFTTRLNAYGAQSTTIGDAFREGVQIQNSGFNIIGICLDPINNGYVTYVPLPSLENVTGIFSPNIALISLNPSANPATALTQIQEKLASTNLNLTAVSLNQVLSKNVSFLNSLWGIVMFLPAFALAAAAMCLVSYFILSIEEQHQEFAILRAIGSKPKTVIEILAAQSITVLLSSFAVGVSYGIMITLLILIPNPVVSTSTDLVISGLLLAALAGMFLISLYPAVKFAKKPILKILS
jgi:putative ABC transport system permease protein